jgi:hypothetical protein
VQDGSGQLQLIEFPLARLALRKDESGTLTWLARPELHETARQMGVPTTATQTDINHGHLARLIGYEAQPTPPEPAGR